MENGSADFLNQLEEALALRARWLEGTRVPQLKDLVGNFRSLVDSAAGTLLKKGLLQEDQYNYEERVSAIAVPPDSALSESDDNAEVSIRIVSYRRQLEFLTDGMLFSLAALDLPTLKKLSAVVSFLDWESFHEGSHSPTTRAMARILTKVRLSKDGLSSRILNESQAQLEKISRGIRERLAELEGWHRESWKAEVRAKVFTHLPPHSPRTGDDRSAKMLAIRKAFEQEMPGSAWHPQLVQEILAEDHPPGTAERREKLIASLAIPQPAAVKEDAIPRFRTELVETIRSVCGAAGEIERCEEVLAANEHELEKRRLNFFQRLRRWFQKSLGRLDDRYYDIEYSQSPAAEARTETIDFLKFVSEMKELRAVLAEILAARSPGRLRLEAMDEEQLCDFLDWQLRQLHQVHRRMEGLNALFHVRAVHERGITVRTIKLELLAIENCFIRADVVRRECIARLEAGRK